MILDKLAESRIVNIIVRLGITICIGCFLTQMYALEEEIKISKMSDFMKAYEDFYEFAVDEDFREDNAKEYTKCLAEWAGEKNTCLLPLDMKTVCWDDEMRVISYENPSSFEADWDLLMFSLKEGRWFKGDANEVICINGSSYEPGDKIEITDINGNTFKAMVVGIAEYPFLPGRNSAKWGADDCVADYVDVKNIFLLNPRSEFNEKVDTVQCRTVFLQTDNSALLSKMREYGTCERVAGLLLEDKPGITKVVSIIVFSIMGLVFLCVLGRIVLDLPEIGWCASVAGYFAYSISFESYLAGLGELFLTIVICAVIGFGYSGIIALIDKWKSKPEDYEVTLVETEKWDDK